MNQMKLTTNDLTQMLLKDPLQRVSAEKLSPGFWQQVQTNHRNKYGCTLPLSEIAKAIDLLIKRDDLYNLDLLLLNIVPNFNIFNERTCNEQSLKSDKRKQPREQPKEVICYIENYEVAHNWFLGLSQADQEHIRTQILNRLYQICHNFPLGNNPFEWQLGQVILVERWKRATNTAYRNFVVEYYKQGMNFR